MELKNILSNAEPDIVLQWHSEKNGEACYDRLMKFNEILKCRRLKKLTLL